jgi:DNA-binding transcriptional LysR family regulator
MSKRLASLQHCGRILHRPWVEREGKQWRLTEEGCRVLPAVEELLRRYEHLTAFVETAGHPGVVFACGREALTSFVLDAVQRFRREQPQAPRVGLATPRGERRIEGVANGLFDLAVVTHDSDQIRAVARRPLVVEDLFDDPLVLACGKDSPCAEAFARLPEKNLSGRALVGLPLVLLEHDGGLRQKFEARLREEGLLRHMDVAAEVAGWAAVLACIEAGLGIGLLPRSMVNRSTSSSSSSNRPLLVRTLLSGLAPTNRVRLIARTQPGTEELDLSEQAVRFRDNLRAAALAFHDATVKPGKPR